MTPPPTFKESVDMCWENADFMREYRRLSGATLGTDPRTQFEKLIDKTTGYEPPVIDEKEALAFFSFVRDYIWMPVVRRCAA